MPRKSFGVIVNYGPPPIDSTQKKLRNCKCLRKPGARRQTGRRKKTFWMGRTGPRRSAVGDLRQSFHRVWRWGMHMLGRPSLPSGRHSATNHGSARLSGPQLPWSSGVRKSSTAGPLGENVISPCDSCTVFCRPPLCRFFPHHFDELQRGDRRGEGRFFKVFLHWSRSGGYPPSVKIVRGCLLGIDLSGM